MAITVRRRRMFLFVAGLVYVIFAQYLIAKTDSVVIPQAFAPLLQEEFRFDVPNLENVLTGIVLLVVAALFLLISFAPFHLPKWDERSVAGGARPGVIRFLIRHAPILILAVVLFVWLIIRLNQIDSGVGSLLIWLVVLVLMLFVCWRYDRKSGTALSLHLNRWDGLWLGVLLIAALLVGTYQLSTVPNSLISDEGNFFTRAQTIAAGQEGQSFFDVGVYTYPLASDFYQGGFLKLFGVSLWSWRFSSVVAGVLILIPLYLLTRDLFDRRTAVIAGLLLVTLPYLVAFERLGYNNVQAILPVALALCLLYLAVQRESVFYFALSGAITGLGFYTYTASRVGLLIAGFFLALVIILKFLSRFRKQSAEAKQALTGQIRRLIGGGVVFLMLALATVVPHLTYVNFVAPESLRYKMLESLLPNINYGLSFFPPEELFRDYAPFHVGNEIFFYRFDLYLRLFVRSAFRSLLVFHDAVLADSEYLASPLSGTVGVLFYYVGLIFALRNVRRKEFALLLIWWFGSIFYLSMISTFPARYQHMIPVIPTIALFTAIGLTVTINALIQWIRRPADAAINANPLRRSFAIITVVLLGVIVITNLRTYFVDMPQKYLPDLENIMSFEALGLQQPTKIFYVYSDPTKASWKPWMIEYMPNPATFQSFSADDFRNNPPNFAANQAYIVYFDEKTAVTVKTVLRHVVQSLSSLPVTYYDDMNRVLGLSYSFIAPADAAGSS